MVFCGLMGGVGSVGSELTDICSWAISYFKVKAILQVITFLLTPFVSLVEICGYNLSFIESLIEY